MAHKVLLQEKDHLFTIVQVASSRFLVASAIRFDDKTVPRGMLETVSTLVLILFISTLLEVSLNHMTTFALPISSEMRALYNSKLGIWVSSASDGKFEKPSNLQLSFCYSSDISMVAIDLIKFIREMNWNEETEISFVHNPTSQDLVLVSKNGDLATLHVQPDSVHIFP